MKLIIGALMSCAILGLILFPGQTDVSRRQTQTAAISGKSLAKPPVMHYADDKTWARKIGNRGEGRDLRYGVSQARPLFADRHLAWKGGKRMKASEIEGIVRKVFKTLPHVKTTDNLVNLVVETAIVESDGGFHTKNRHGDCGMFQIKAWVSEETKGWLRYAYRDIHDAIMSLRNPDLSEEDNLIRNLPYAAAMCVTCYWRAAGAGFRDMISTRLDRAELWKSVYNTRKGEGTVNDYLRRAAKYSA